MLFHMVAIMATLAPWVQQRQCIQQDRSWGIKRKCTWAHVGQSPQGGPPEPNLAKASRGSNEGANPAPDTAALANGFQCFLRIWGHRCRHLGDATFNPRYERSLQLHFCEQRAATRAIYSTSLKASEASPPVGWISQQLRCRSISHAGTFRSWMTL